MSSGNGASSEARPCGLCGQCHEGGLSGDDLSSELVGHALLRKLTKTLRNLENHVRGLEPAAPGEDLSAPIRKMDIEPVGPFENDENLVSISCSADVADGAVVVSITSETLENIAPRLKPEVYAAFERAAFAMLDDDRRNFLSRRLQVEVARLQAEKPDGFHEVVDKLNARGLRLWDRSSIPHERLLQNALEMMRFTNPEFITSDLRTLDLALTLLGEVQLLLPVPNTVQRPATPEEIASYRREVVLEALENDRPIDPEVAAALNLPVDSDGTYQLTKAGRSSAPTSESQVNEPDPQIVQDAKEMLIAERGSFNSDELEETVEALQGGPANPTNNDAVE